MSGRDMNPILSASCKLDGLQSQPPPSQALGIDTEVHIVSLSSDNNRGTRRRRLGAVSMRRSAGFNLVELVVTMTIAAILMAMGVSSYKYVMNSERVSSEVNALLGDMQYARSEAVRQGQPVSVCPSQGGAQCDANSTTWQNGWIVFSDLNGNGSFDQNVDVVLQKQAAFTSHDTLVPSDNNVFSITFNRDGFTTNIPSADMNTGVTFRLNTSPAISQWERCLNIAWVGIIATQRPNTSPATCS